MAQKFIFSAFSEAKSWVGSRVRERLPEMERPEWMSRSRLPNLPKLPKIGRNREENDREEADGKLVVLFPFFLPFFTLVDNMKVPYFDA